MESEQWEVLDRVAGRLSEAGLDIFHAFDIASYNEAILEHPRLLPLPLFGRSEALGLLIGNTRELWPRFRSAYRARVELQQERHPLDRYVTDVVTDYASVIPARTELRFSHEGGPRLVSMLHVAQASGFAHLGPAHLAIHPTYGPWFGLRAVIAVDADAPPARPAPIPPCEGCPAPCKDAMAHAMAAGAGSSWQDWLAVRDACPVGRSSRYSEPQILYHYTKERLPLEEPPPPSPLGTGEDG